MQDIQTPSDACPKHVMLLAFAEGTLSSQQSEIVTAHVASCDECDARLEQIEEQSDVLLQALASLPASEDDEETFREVQAELLAHPESFLGTELLDPTEAFEQQVPFSFTLPIQLGNYELLEQIGAGAHGAVFRARHTRLDRIVAVKLLIRSAGPYVEEFLNEMRVVGRLDHPNIVRATDAGEYKGTYFLVMEFVPGLDVSSLLRRTGPLTVADACEITRQAAIGLAFAHKNRLVHRDVKTSNLLFTARGQIKLLDLGLATISTGSEDAERPNESGPRGTADYMAPEQWHESDKVTEKADLYSLGCTLFKLLTGSPPFRPLPQGVASLQQAHATLPMPALSTFRKDVPTEIERLLSDLLAKAPDDRPASAQAVADVLERHTANANLSRMLQDSCPDLLEQESLHPSAPHDDEPTHRRQRTSRRSALLATAFALVAILFLATQFWQNQSVPIDVMTWRDLAPVKPFLIRVSPDTSASFSTDEQVVTLVSEDLALLHLGNPLAVAYRWQTTLQRPSWQDSAGIFFRLRKTGDATEGSSFTFQSIEVHEPPATPDGTMNAPPNENAADSNGSSSVAVIWCAYDTQQQDRVVLAETSTQISGHDEVTLEVIVGRSGFPEIYLNGEHLPPSKWTLSREARDFVAANLEQLPVFYSGRIGIVQHGQRTSIPNSKLMYLTD